ncbi:hypothetical protein AVEN_59622-1 [Araneus ventricosus]|uniref:Uncharacterized protein n=1 Tax=Araneus ventricosus TaxID=182803 RepID=A0A4Y2S284_ARAVE|nr:hypothetical protein AVEN_59622-1 [Araneus ventricosus]
MSIFGSDDPIVLTSMQGKNESLMGQDQGCRPSDPISPIPANECVLLCSLLCGVLHYRPGTKPLNSRALIEPHKNQSHYRRLWECLLPRQVDHCAC